MFVKKILGARGHPTERAYLLYAELKNQTCYYYVLVDPHKEPAFLAAIAGEAGYDLKDFGQVLASGYGEPSEELRKEMWGRYKLMIAEE